MNKMELSKHVEQVFDDVEYPGDDNLVYDQSGEHMECNEIAAKFQRQHWRDLDVITLRSEAAALFFFSERAYVYFLPAYLKTAILDPEEADTIPGAVVDSLSVCQQLHGTGCEGSRLQWLTDKQLGVVTEVLVYFKTMYLGENVLGDVDNLLGGISQATARGLRQPLRAGP
jgi:hypothetical protein